MAGWITGITAAIALTTLIDVLIAEGETKKYVKGIASLLIFAAIIVPLPSLLNSGFEFSDDGSGVISMNESYLERVYMERYKSRELAVQNKLKQKGLDGVTVRIEIEYKDGLVEIVKVTADISALVITGGTENIDIKEIIVATITESLYVNESKVIIT